MTQSDAEGGQAPNSAEASQPSAEASQPATKSEKDVTDYHGQLLEQLRHVEDTINKFAIQNYAASGAVVLAYLADKAPLWATIIIVALLNINFAIAIFVQVARVHKLFTMHCIVRNFWLDNRPELLRRLQANTISNEVLATTTLPRWVTIVILLAQFLPIFSLLLAHRLMNTWPTTLTRASRGPCRSIVQAVFGPNLANNLFASSCDKRRPGDGFFTTTMGMSMNDNEGALAVIIIGQWVTVALLALILWRVW